MPSETTPGTFPAEQPVDRSATGISYQAYQVNARARGSALGRGLRVTPESSSMFSQPNLPMSGGQFGGGHAKSIASLPEGGM